MILTRSLRHLFDRARRDESRKKAESVASGSRRFELWEPTTINKMKVKICFEIEDHQMSQVTGSFTINVIGATPPPTPLAIDPSTGALPDETEGAPVSGVVATVSGGVPPYSYEITGQPDGVTFNEAPSADGEPGDADITIAGAPVVGSAANSPYTVEIVVTDSATPSASAKLSRSIG
jgi:hypothetical protein